MIPSALSVWVVDDDESVRWVLEQALRQARMMPRCFESGADLFEALEGWIIAFRYGNHIWAVFSQKSRISPRHPL